MRLLKPGLLIASFALLTSCSRLPSGLRQDIAYQNDRLSAAEYQLQYSQRTLESDLSARPDLFRNASEPAQWKARLDSDHDKLNSAQNIQRQLIDLARHGRSDAQSRAEQLLARERRLLETAGTDSDALIAAADHWLHFRRDLPSHLDEMRREYAAVSNFDLAPVAKDVTQADHDWPAKKTALDQRLDALRAIPKQAQTQWTATNAVREAAVNGNLSGNQLATLIETDDHLASDVSTMAAENANLQSLCGQLYDSWDKILSDLDESRYRGDQVFRARVKTVRTHLIDVTSKKTETTSDEHWTTVSPAQFRAVQGDLGMAIAHKDAGVFDSEAQTTPQPAGFAYIAPVSQGSNQYGYWDHSNGHSVWTWLPEYLILRELLWHHDYRPVLADEYRAYRTAQSAGRTFYGQTSPTAPPKYGTHGTFTERHYADSRYAQHGGFNNSRYTNHPGSANARGSEPFHLPGSDDNTVGRRFGSGVHPPSGHQFGRPGGFRGGGRRFGRR